MQQRRHSCTVSTSHHGRGKGPHVMAWLGMVLQGWSAGAGCGNHTSPA